MSQFSTILEITQQSYPHACCIITGFREGTMNNFHKYQNSKQYTESHPKTTCRLFWSSQNLKINHHTTFTTDSKALATDKGTNKKLDLYLFKITVCTSPSSLSPSPFYQSFHPSLDSPRGRLCRWKVFIMLCDNREELVTHLVGHKAWVSCGKDACSLG